MQLWGPTIVAATATINGKDVELLKAGQLNKSGNAAPAPAEVNLPPAGGDNNLSRENMLNRQNIGTAPKALASLKAEQSRDEHKINGGRVSIKINPLIGNAPVNYFYMFKKSHIVGPDQSPAFDTSMHPQR